jgi:hypothetical protein
MWEATMPPADYRDLRRGDTSLQDWQERCTERAQEAVRDRHAEMQDSIIAQLEEVKRQFATDLAAHDDKIARSFERVVDDVNEAFDNIERADEKRMAEIEQRVMVKFIERFLSSGLAVKTLAVKGTFDPHERYRALDIVAKDGGSFVARKDDPGPCPGEGWQSITTRGQRGVAGERGERGPAGPIGPAAPKHIGWQVDAANYSVVGLLSDGTQTAPLDLRPLFQQFQDETT